MANDLQRSNEWYLARKGKLTASEIYVLLNNRKEDVPLTEEDKVLFRQEHPRAKIPDTKKIEVPFNDASYKYIDEKIAECYMPDDSYLEYIDENRYETAAMRWGTFWEDTARKRYADVMGEEIIDMPFVPLKGFEKFSGASPDGLVRHKNALIEIKCPYSPAVHMKYLLFKNPQDLMDEKLQYYVQMQHNILSVEKEIGQRFDYVDFISFDPRVSASKQMKILRIPRDEEMINLLLERIECAVLYMREKMEEINSAEVTIIS